MGLTQETLQSCHSGVMSGTLGQFLAWLGQEIFAAFTDGTENNSRSFFVVSMPPEASK